MSEVTVFIGDSVTDCGREVLSPFGDGYVSLIAASNRLPGRIINVGTSGHRLVDLEARWKRDVLDFSPTRVSIAIGINDTWRRYDDNDPTSTTDFKESYIRVIDSLMTTGNPALVLCEPFLLPVREEMKVWREDLDPKIAVVHELAKKYGAILVPFDAHFAALSRSESMETLADDGIHPTIQGHTIMADLWLSSVSL
jgi:lysophospholipase L1-like esterase